MAKKILTAVIIAVFLISGLLTFYILNKKPENTVTITQDGKLLYTLDLNKEPNRTIEIEYEGRKNIIEIKDGRIRMKSADCPDKVCVNSGWLDSLPIVCLPNKLVIESQSQNENDAVVT